MNIDVPQLTNSGIHFVSSFTYTYSIQSSSITLYSSAFVDAEGLNNYIRFGELSPSTTSHVVASKTEFLTIPLNVKDLWIGRFDSSERTDLSLDHLQSLKSLVIGNGVFWNTDLRISNLPSLEYIDIGKNSFSYGSQFSLTSLTMRMN